MSTPITDITRAIATLSLEHGIPAPDVALRMITAADGNDTRLVAALLHEAREPEILSAIAAEMAMRFVDLNIPQPTLRLDPALLELANSNILKEHSTLLMRMVSDPDAIVAVMANPFDTSVLTYLSEDHNMNPEVALGVRNQIQARLTLAVSGFEGTEIDEYVPQVTAVDPQARLQTTSPLLAWIDQLLERAVAENASDVHFSSQANQRMSVRLRVDGVLRQFPSSFPGRASEVIGALMTQAQMDPANIRDPQDGQFTFHAAGRSIDVRAAMLPLMTGPAVVLRLLDSANIKRRVSDMGFNDEQLHVLRKFTASNQGMTIVSGPTGSGKTTTLYALLREISSLDRHVATIEDPVEYRLPLINQVQVRHTESKPLTFASALRALMRMDPDVILVGEIRDAETAKVALDAAITGHLVLSTVHARDAAGTFERLVEIGAPPYVVADAVSVSVAQRLIRRVHTCATMMPVSDSEARRLEMLGLEIPKMLAHPTGCELCANTGYQGRVAIAEVLTSTPQIREMIRAMAGHDAIVSEARKFGFETMADHTQKMLVNGVTSLEEVGRILEDITDIGSA